MGTSRDGRDRTIATTTRARSQRSRQESGRLSGGRSLYSRKVISMRCEDRRRCEPKSKANNQATINPSIATSLA